MIFVDQDEYEDHFGQDEEGLDFCFESIGPLKPYFGKSAVVTFRSSAPIVSKIRKVSVD